jgi:hypothetical protein
VGFYTRVYLCDVNHRPSLYGPIPLKRSDFASFRCANKKQPFAKTAIFASKTVKFDEKVAKMAKK